MKPSGAVGQCQQTIPQLTRPCQSSPEQGRRLESFETTPGRQSNGTSDSRARRSPRTGSTAVAVILACPERHPKRLEPQENSSPWSVINKFLTSRSGGCLFGQVGPSGRKRRAIRQTLFAIPASVGIPAVQKVIPGGHSVPEEERNVEETICRRPVVGH